MASAIDRIAAAIERCNVLVSRRRWHLVELTDQWFCPQVFREANQEMLTAQWAFQIPILQKQSPAALVSSILYPVLSEIERRYPSKTELQVVDFCSGGGGPIPFIEKHINAKRKQKKLTTIPFMVSDLFPDVDAWLDICQASDNLSFIPQSVDAANPPASCLNEDVVPSVDQPSRRVFHTFNLSFHHFTDAQAVRILASSMEHSDGFGIFELQDRRISSLILMVVEFIFVMIVTIFWFPRNIVRLLFTYVIPLCPWLHMTDGSVSCLRSRTFEEVLDLVDIAAGDAKLEDLKNKGKAIDFDGGNTSTAVKRHGWIFEGGRTSHTWPLGHLTWVIARKEPTHHLRSASLRSARRQNARP